MLISYLKAVRWIDTFWLFLGTTIVTGVNTLERPPGNISQPLFKMLLELCSYFLQQSIDVELSSAT